MSSAVSLTALNTITVLPSRCALMSECCIEAAPAFNFTRAGNALSMSSVPISAVSRRTGSLSGFLMSTIPSRVRCDTARRSARDNAFEPHRTRVPEHGVAIVGEMVDELDAGHRFAEQPEEFPFAVEQRHVARSLPLHSTRSNASSTAASLRRLPRSALKSDRPSSRNTTTSPSITKLSALRRRAARTMPGSGRPSRGRCG